MKKIFRKNQVIITTLAFLIAIAGYISYDRVGAGKEKEDAAGQEDVAVNADLDDPDYQIALTDETEKKDSVETMATENADQPTNPGEAVLTGTTASAIDNAAEIKLNREQVRSKNNASLNEIINNEALSNEQKQEAVDQLVKLTELAEKEAAAESLLVAKGFTDVVVSLSEDSCDVILDMGEVTDAKCAQVEDIVKRKTEISADKIVITPIHQSSETVIETPNQ